VRQEHRCVLYHGRVRRYRAARMPTIPMPSDGSPSLKYGPFGLCRGSTPHWDIRFHCPRYAAKLSKTERDVIKSNRPDSSYGAEPSKSAAHYDMTGLSASRRSQPQDVANATRVYDATMTGPHRLPCETPDALRAPEAIAPDAIDTRWVLPVTILGSSM